MAVMRKAKYEVDKITRVLVYIVYWSKGDSR